jgi:hypothetical protein
VRYFKYETSKSSINLYPLVCWHRGAPQSDAGFIEAVVDRIQHDPDGYWVYLGDGGECVTKSSKGDVYSQTLSPTDQQADLVRRLGPIRGRGLFGIRGNHGNRIYKETGLDFDETLCAKLGIPYLGTSAFWHLKLRTGAEHPGIFSIFAHHGVDSGVGIGTKVTKGQAFERTIVSDAILTAHSHIAIELPPRYYASLAERGANPMKWNETREYICGSAYDSRTGYAEDKGYPPLLPSHLVINFAVDSQGKKSQSSTVIRKEDI